MASSSPDSAPRAVFLSYAREDTEPAKRIADALRAFGVEVWFDQSELRGGDAWDTKIRTQIKTCALFVPLISTQTEDRTEGYFRREWKLAVDRTQDMAGGKSFIVPVAIDDTPEADAAVPEDFMRYQWTRLAHGVPSPQFVEQIKRLLDAPRKAPAVGRPVSHGEGTTPPAPEVGRALRARLGWLAGLAIVISLGAVAWNFSRTESAASSEPAARRSAPPTPTLADKSVAVLAFTDLSEKRDSEYFSDGVSEELLNVLAKVPGLRVAARTSAFSFKGKNVPIPEIASKLNVAYVVEGSVQRAGENVRITAQLIKAADGYHVWSEHFDRELKNVFVVQDEIAGLIANQLSLKLGANSPAATASVNPQALELYLQARQAWNLRTTEGFTRAEQLLDQALQLEPNFARPHAALADVWLLRGQTAAKIGAFSQRDSPEMARLLAKARQALALDPNSAEAHASLGNACWMGWQFADAIREDRLAIALNPNYASAHQWLGRALLDDGRMDDAVAELKRAAELDPLSSRILDNYAYALREAGRPDESLAVAERALALQPNSAQALSAKSLALLELRRVDEAIAVARTFASRDRIDFSVEIFARAGRQAEADALLPAAKGDAEEFYSLAAAGHTEEAIAAFTASRLSVIGLGFFFFEPACDAMRGDPRVAQTLATVGATEANARAQAWRAAHSTAKPK